MFICNRYTIIYFKIIFRAILQNRKKKHGIYYELHHIFPKSKYCWPELKLAKWNKVLLTAKEHILCHLILIRITEGKMKAAMYHAANRMIHQNKNHHKRYINLGLIAMAREYNAKASSILNKGRVNSPEHRKLISETRKKQTYYLDNLPKNVAGSNNAMFGKTHTEESRKLISKTKKEKYTTEMKERVGKYRRGKTYERNVWMRKSRRNKKQIQRNYEK